MPGRLLPGTEAFFVAGMQMPCSGTAALVQSARCRPVTERHRAAARHDTEGDLGRWKDDIAHNTRMQR